MSRWFVVGQTEEERRYKSRILAVHAALLHTGEIIYFGGDQHDPGQNALWRQQRDNHQEPVAIENTCLFNCMSFEVTPISSPTTDVFCSGHALMGDGRLLVAGGTEFFPTEVNQNEHHDHFPGLNNAWIYDPQSRSWIEATRMNPQPGRKVGGGRWYSTLVTLSSGEILAMSGHPSKDDMRHSNDTPEKFSGEQSPTGTWIALRQIGQNTTYYPRLHVIPPTGNVFCTSDLFGGDRRGFQFDPNGSNDPIFVCDFINQTHDPGYSEWSYTSVLLPLLPDNYNPRILLCGSQQPLIFNFSSGSPLWQPTSQRAIPGNPRRYHVNSVILPTGEVFICGGVSVNNSNDTDEEINSVLAAELYNPKTNTWRVLESAHVIRNYHSVALLMPDGRVWTAGSNKNGSYSFRNSRHQFEPVDEPGADFRELRIEIYEPWYSASSDRPRIVSSPTELYYREAFSIGFESSGMITSAAMIRAGSVTHAFNPDQRYVGLVIRKGGKDLWLVSPPTSSVAPPGYYLLFIIDKYGTPSTGKFVRLHDDQAKLSIFEEIRILVKPGTEEPDPVIYLKSIKGINELLSRDNNEALLQLAEIRKQLTDIFKNGNMGKSAYDILDKAILKLIDRIRD